MEIGSFILPTMKFNEIRALRKDRKIRAEAKKKDLEKAMRAWEEAHQAQELLDKYIIADSGEEEHDMEAIEEGKEDGHNGSLAPQSK
ncbi:hypothetical protein NDU88_006196 [Pleurodeles waltl]|uniref:Uncharacterized protein n=1 Tax=Pleurodeles waltl TaxID=8319 RepID=A0AAV7QKI0_PLEWA|nr:hypothetical protein NDU88_006196 [Pleurodeles waltl]